MRHPSIEFCLKENRFSIVFFRVFLLTSKQTGQSENIINLLGGVEESTNSSIRATTENRLTRNESRSSASSSSADAMPSAESVLPLCVCVSGDWSIQVNLYALWTPGRQDVWPKTCDPWPPITFQRTTACHVVLTLQCIQTWP